VRTGIVEETEFTMQQVPTWWVLASGIYFIISIVWSIGLVAGLLMVYQKVMPIIAESRIQVRRVTDQAKGIATKASSTAEIVHVQTQKFLGNANSAGNLVTQQARTIGAALTGVLIAARVINFVRKIL
jgi:hypothetical protein